MASTTKSVVQRLLERAHSPDTATQIYADKIRYRPQLLRPTSPTLEAASGTAADSAAGGPAAGLSGLDGREARRRSRRIKQERRQAHRPKPKPLSSRQRRKLGLYDLPINSNHKLQAQSYSTFLPLHRLWLGYIREVLSPKELRTGGQNVAAKLTAADFHGAQVEVTRSACVGRVGIRGIVVRDTRFIFEIVTPDNKVKMVPKEGTFFQLEIPVEDAGEERDTAEKHDTEQNLSQTKDDNSKEKLVVEILGSQFMHRAADRANRKFKQHFFKTL